MVTNQTIFTLFERIAQYYGEESAEELILRLSNENMNDVIWELFSSNIGTDLSNAKSFRTFYETMQHCVEYCNCNIFHRLLETYHKKTDINLIMLIPCGNDLLEYLISYGVGSTEFIDNYCNMIHDLLSHGFIPRKKHYEYLEKLNRKDYKIPFIAMFANWSISDERVANIEKIRKVMDLFDETNHLVQD